MNKNMSFIESPRKENGNIPPEERIRNFKEFHPYLDEKTRRVQAGRCMNCGVPMCQSAIKLSEMVTGCPLHNLIPEWNDALYNGQFDMAAWRLLKTSNFPEFTGRVCPALCEKACNCGNIASSCDAASATDTDIKPVTIHDNELFIIEKAFATGYMKSETPKVRSGKKVAVIGSGPSGLAVADMLNHRGHYVTVFEREDRAGGLLMYGIPNMKLDKTIVERRVKLMESEGVKFIFNADIGRKEGSATDSCEMNITPESLLVGFDAIAFCCGAKKPRALSVPGSNAEGVFFAVDFLKSVTKSLLASNLSDEKYENPKGKHVIIVGGGDTGNDCTGTCIRLGAKSVTQIEMMKCPPVERAADNPWPQWPKVLKTDYGAEESIAVYGHDPRIYETTIKEIHTENGKVHGVTTVEVEFVLKDGNRTLVEREGTERELEADIILVAAGFVGCENYTADAFNLELSPRGTVSTASPDTYSTNSPKIFTAGDMHRGQSLVVWAIAEGRECAREIDNYLMGYSNM